MTSPMVLNSVFFHCQDFTLDPFWKDLFSRCAYNKFPKRVKYDRLNNTVYVKALKGPRKESFSLSSNPEEVFTTMMNIFRNIGIRSPRDLKIKKEEIEAIRKELCVDLNCSWKELRPKYLKDRMITRYTLSLEKKHKLTSKETKKLLTTIQLGFQLKQLTSNDVEYSNGEITNIKGVVFEEKTRSFSIPRKINTTKKSSKSTNSDHFLQLFENQLKEIKRSSIRL